MKYLAMASTALFLLASPGIAMAQSADGTAGSGTTAGAGATTDTGTAGAGANTTTGAGATELGATGAKIDSVPNPTGGDSQCNDATAASGYDSFSEKCRNQIDAWAASQAGKSASFEGDVVVGAVVPDTVEIVEVPVYHDYGYVMLNDRRVLVDRSTRKVVRVY